MSRRLHSRHTLRLWLHTHTYTLHILVHTPYTLHVTHTVHTHTAHTYTYTPGIHTVHLILQGIAVTVTILLIKTIKFKPKKAIGKRCSKTQHGQRVTHTIPPAQKCKLILLTLLYEETAANTISPQVNPRATDEKSTIRNGGIAIYVPRSSEISTPGSQN